MKEVFQILNQIDGGVVLDAATGKGEFINVLKKHLRSFSKIIGVDVSEKSVDYAQKVFPENDVEIYRMNLEDLPFEDDHFDTVCTANSLHHFENKDKVFSEMMRVLKPGGTFILTEMYADGDQSPAQNTHILMHHWVAKVDSISGVYHSHTLDKAELEKVIRKLHLQKKKIIDFYPQVDDPKDSKVCSGLINNCHTTLKRLEHIDAPAELKSEGHEIIKRIKEIGCASASRLLVIGHKKKGDK